MNHRTSFARSVFRSAFTGCRSRKLSFAVHSQPQSSSSFGLSSSSSSAKRIRGLCNNSNSCSSNYVPLLGVSTRSHLNGVNWTPAIVRASRFIMTETATAEEFKFVEEVLVAREPAFQPGPAASAVIGSNLEGAMTRLRGLVESCGPAAKAHWLGKGAVEEALVAQWLQFKVDEFDNGSNKQAALADLNTFLVGKSFLACANHGSLADVCMFWAVKGEMKPEMAKNLPSLCRWFDQMQNYLKLPVVAFKFEDSWNSLSFSSQGASSAGGAAAPSGSAGNKNEKQQKQQKQPQQQQQQQQQGKKKEKKEKKAKQPKAAAPAAPEQPLITKLDFRVGKVVKCWNHPDSEKLLCEEVDVGEEKPRKIASGIAQFYKPEELEGRKVVVLANLKSRKIAGFESHGMVVCASNEDKSQVEILDPGAAPVGERILHGLEGEPFAPFGPPQVKKKKVFETAAPNMKTNDNCQAFWKDEQGKECIFTTTAGPCKVPSIKGGSVS